MVKTLLSIAAFLACGPATAAEFVHTFKKIQLTDQFWSEGANIGDFNHDGKMDVVSGPFWYEGPDFRKRHEFTDAMESFKKKNPDGTETTIPGYEGALGHENTYSQNFFA